MGNVLVSMQRHEEALQKYKAAARTAPSAEVYNKQAVILALLNHPMEALAVHARAIQLDPTSASAFTGIGHALYQLECYYEALIAYRRAIELDPGYADAYNGKGNILRDLACYKEAYEDYSRALQLDPHCASAHFWKRQVWLSMRTPIRRLPESTADTAGQEQVSDVLSALVVRGQTVFAALASWGNRARELRDA